MKRVALFSGIGVLILGVLIGTMIYRLSTSGHPTSVNVKKMPSHDEYSRDTKAKTVPMPSGETVVEGETGETLVEGETGETLVEGETEDSSLESLSNEDIAQLVAWLDSLDEENIADEDIESLSDKEQEEETKDEFHYGDVVDLEGVRHLKYDKDLGISQLPTWWDPDSRRINAKFGDRLPLEASYYYRPSDPTRGFVHDPYYESRPHRWVGPVYTNGRDEFWEEMRRRWEEKEKNRMNSY